MAVRSALVLVSGIPAEMPVGDTLSGAGGPFSVLTRTATSTETATSGQVVLLANLAAGFTINLPTAIGNTAVFTVKKLLAAGQIVVDPFGTQTVDGGLTAALSNQYESITLVSDNANWWVI